MNKLLFITPHLSTGGLPQYLVKKIESFKNEYEIWCIEYSNLSDDFVVQKNKIKKLLTNNLITLGDNKFEIINHIKNISPDVIHFEEVPESFINDNILNIIYDDSRNYLDPSDWNWCPDYKGTERQFECSKMITSNMVIEKIKGII